MEKFVSLSTCPGVLARSADFGRNMTMFNPDSRSSPDHGQEFIVHVLPPSAKDCFYDCPAHLAMPHERIYAPRHDVYGSVLIASGFFLNPDPISP